MLITAIDDLEDCPATQRVRVTRVIVLEGPAERVRQILSAPGMHLTKVGETKNSMTEIARVLEVMPEGLYAL